jgi:SAM-dependent methyltransferase
MDPYKGRANALCPRCGSLERHRLLARYLRNRTTILTEATDILHVAPEIGLMRVLRRAKRSRTVSIDLKHPLADRKMDVRSLEFPDGSFDVAICSHVLEHVVEDRLVMAELHRVLRAGGMLIAMVPWDRTAATTREDPRVTEPAQRLLLYGQADHVRLYGRDLLDRLKGAGFDVLVDEFGAHLPQQIVRRQALSRQPILRCTKPLAPGT